MQGQLNHKLALIHQSLLAGKLPRNLDWNDVLELIRHLGEVQPHGGDEFAFVVGNKREFFKRPHDHGFGVEELSRLRRFLRGAGAVAGTSNEVQPHRMVVVIDHKAAHIYQDLNGLRPQQHVTVEPYDPYGFHRHLIHRKEAHYQGERVPEESSFYQEVAETLVSADEIVLIGHATGKSSAVNVLVEQLQHHHPELYQRVKSVEAVDLSALSEAEVEAIAKRHMSAA